MAEPGPFVLVPGAGGSSWFWHPVVDELTGRGHTAVAVDLPADDESAGMDAFVDTIVATADGLGEVVLVAHSLGGFSAVPASFQLPVSRLILVNAMIPNPGETAGDWWGNTGSHDAKVEFDVQEGRDPDGEFDLVTYFFHDVPDSIADERGNHAKEQTDRFFGDPCPFETWPDLPTHVIASRADRLFPFEFQRRVAKERLGLEAIELPGGHLAALAQPVELTDIILACCAA